MGFFKKSNQSAGGLPPGIIDMMEQFGRFEFDPQGSGIEGSRVWDEFQAPLLRFVQSDPNGFVESLAGAVIPVGGWAAYGASRTVSNLLDPEFQNPAYDAIRDASLPFLRENGVPNSRLSGYEWQYWLSHDGRSEPWLVGLPIPSDSAGAISAFEGGELRRVVQIFPESDSNVILVRSEGGRYVSVIDARRNDEDPTRSQGDWLESDDLADLYRQIGESFQVPTFWADPELGPYFPLPRPTV